MQQPQPISRKPKRGRPANQTTEETPARVAPEADVPHARSLLALGIGAVAYFVVVMAASSRPSPMTWGIDLPGYLSSPARALVALLALSSLGLLLSGILGSKRARPDRGHKPARLGLYNGIPWLPWILLIPYGCLLWVARTRSHLLGDQMIWLECFRTHQQRLFSEPLAAGIWYAFAGALEGAGVGIGLPLLAVLPVLCGLVAAILLWKISGLLVPPG